MTERLVLEVTTEERRQLKTLAAFSGMTMKRFILSKTLGLETKPTAKKRAVKDETARIRSSKAMTRRLEAAVAEKSTKRKAFNSLDEVRHALGIRK